MSDDEESGKSDAIRIRMRRAFRYFIRYTYRTRRDHVPRRREDPPTTKTNPYRNGTQRTNATFASSSRTTTAVRAGGVRAIRGRTDRGSPNGVRRVWVSAHPLVCRLSTRVDDGPRWTWTWRARGRRIRRPDLTQTGKYARSDRAVPVRFHDVRRREWPVRVI